LLHEVTATTEAEDSRAEAPAAAFLAEVALSAVAARREVGDSEPENMKSRFTPEEHQRIDAAMAAMKSDTSADLCVVVTPVSDRYPLYPITAAAIGAILLGALISLFRPETAIRTVIEFQLCFLIVMTLLLDWLPLRLFIVPERVKHAHAWQLAHREFNAHTIANPNQRHRILLFVSLGERYVEIIADPETHAMAPDGAWKKIVDRFLANVKAGRAADGVLDAIASCGAILKEHHPAQAS
jgi:putative membrane protein